MWTLLDFCCHSITKIVLNMRQIDVMMWDVVPKRRDLLIGRRTPFSYWDPNIRFYHVSSLAPMLYHLVHGYTVLTKANTREICMSAFTLPFPCLQCPKNIIFPLTEHAPTPPFPCTNHKCAPGLPVEIWISVASMFILLLPSNSTLYLAIPYWTRLMSQKHGFLAPLVACYAPKILPFSHYNYTIL